jgi:glucosamine--fructose-6-phosphate aminotransferase (isomerizing)
MCGIVGYTGGRAAAPVLLSGLRRLEYRGYDSSGIALISRKRLRCWKAAGKLQELESQLPENLPGRYGIGHTRWATHGKPSNENAHPHLDADVSTAIVHNGIIENAVMLREMLQGEGVEMVSETDSEVLAHLIARADGESLQQRVLHCLAQVRGAWGVVVASTAEPDTLIAARNGSPVILGIGEGEMFVASDASALARYTRQVVHLDDGEVAIVRPDGFEVIALDAQPMTKTAITIEASTEDYERGGFEHFMRKEIQEQPEAVARTLSGRLDERFNTAHLGGLNLTARELLDIRRIKILGCGSAYYAGISGAGMIETLARIPASAEPAAEFRYRNPVIESDTLYIVVSQSGETFDTLAALREVQRKGGRVLGIVNAVGSTIAREVDGGVYMHAGPEISVASTKVYTCMNVVFALLALHLGRVRDMSPQQGCKMIEGLQVLPQQIEQALTDEAHIAAVAGHYANCNSAFFIGRAAAWPAALEGAQKLKEISYLHAEAYPSSELKHGPLALVDADMPTIAIVPDDDLLEKSLASIEEVAARSGPVIAVTNSEDQRVTALADHVLRAPVASALLSPILLGIPLQLFAYHCAIARGLDVDQPRNLAKSVTVE